MTTSRRPGSIRSALIASGLALVLVTVPVVLTWRAYQQARLNNNLVNAIKSNDPNGVLVALHAGANPNSRDNPAAPALLWQVLLEHLKGNSNSGVQGDPALSLAICLHADYEDFQPPLVVPYQDTRVIKILVEAGASPNLITAEGSTALIQAVEWLGPETVQLLLDHNASVNVKDKDGITPLLIAVGKPEITTARLLLAHGADIAARDNVGQTPLMQAAQSGTPEMVRYLLQQRADIEAKDNRGMTALQHALDGYNTHAVRLLKQAGVKR